MAGRHRQTQVRLYNAWQKNQMFTPDGVVIGRQRTHASEGSRLEQDIDPEQIAIPYWPAEDACILIVEGGLWRRGLRHQ